MRPWLPVRTSRMVSAALLVLANLVPLVGVLILDWPAGSILYIYWLESGIVGVYNVLRMAFAQGPLAPEVVAARGQFTLEQRARLDQSLRDLGRRQPRVARYLAASLQATAPAIEKAPGAHPSSAVSDSPAAPSALRGLAAVGRLVIIGFFIVHYGLFMAGHGVFLYVFFGPPQLTAAQALVVGSALVVSHGVSYAVHFMLGGEYLWVTPQQQMGRPYGRIVIMQLAIIFGGMLTMSLGTPVGLLVVLVLVKTGIDLAAHLRSHAPYESLRSALAGG